jgi:hypothetical protein
MSFTENESGVEEFIARPFPESVKNNAPEIIIEEGSHILIYPTSLILDDRLLHVTPTLRFIFPEIARKAQLGEDGEVDLFGFEDLQGPEHFVFVGFNVGDHRVEVGDANRKMAIVCGEGPFEDNEAILKAGGHRVLYHRLKPPSTEIMLRSAGLSGRKA